MADTKPSLEQLMDQLRLEIRYPLLPPVVTALSQEYFHIYPQFNLLCVPLAETCTVKLKVPAVLGVPLITAPDNVKPAGSAPDVTDQL